MEKHSFWWERESLHYRENRLYFCGRDVAAFAGAFSEPVFLYEAGRPAENLCRLRTALQSQDIEHRIYYAMKANRFRPLLCRLHDSHLFGVDVCSTEEMREAMACGFRPEQISYTAHGFMPEDATFLAAFPDTIVNCDTISSIRLLGKHSPGRRIGIRVNPGIGVGYADNEKLHYAGSKTTKFGIYAEQLEQALATAEESGLEVNWLHCHAGCGFLDAQLESFEQVLIVLKGFMSRVSKLRGVNLGGGLGLPHRAGDRALDLTRWAELIKRHVAKGGIEIAIEPGDYVVKDAGMLVLRTSYAETKRDQRFIGVNGGFNLAVEPAFYDLPCEPVPCLMRSGERSKVTIAGNINEALDIWAGDIEFPHVEEGDFIAFLNAGGYASSMSSNHCMRGQFREFLLV